MIPLDRKIPNHDTTIFSNFLFEPSKMSYRGYSQAYPNVSYNDYPEYDESHFYVTPRSSNYNGVGSPRRQEYRGISRQGHEHTFIPGAKMVSCPEGSVHWGNASGGGCTGFGVTPSNGVMSPRSRHRSPGFQNGHPQRNYR